MTVSLATESEETPICKVPVTRGSPNSLGEFSSVLHPNFGTGWGSRRDQERSTDNETPDHTDVSVNDYFNSINVTFNQFNDNNNNRARTIDVTKTSEYGARSYSDDIVAKFYKPTVMPIAGSFPRSASPDRYSPTESSPES